MSRATVAEGWAEVVAAAEAARPLTAGERIEARRAYYAGCRRMLAMMQALSAEMALNTVENSHGVQAVEALEAELDAFTAAVREGRA